LTAGLSAFRDVSSLSTARKLTAAARTDITGLCFIARSAILRRLMQKTINPRALKGRDAVPRKSCA
jgi:hypothetical protein